MPINHDICWILCWHSTFYFPFLFTYKWKAEYTIVERGRNMLFKLHLQWKQSKQVAEIRKLMKMPQRKANWWGSWAFLGDKKYFLMFFPVKFRFSSAVSQFVPSPEETFSPNEFFKISNKSGNFLLKFQIQFESFLWERHLRKLWIY